MNMLSSPLSLMNRNFNTISQVELHLHRNLNNECPVFPVSSTDIHFKTILLIKHRPKELCLMGDLNSEHTASSPVFLINMLFQGTFHGKFYEPEKLCVLGVLNNKHEWFLLQCHQQMATSGPSSE